MATWNILNFMELHKLMQVYATGRLTLLCNIRGQSVKALNNLFICLPPLFSCFVLLLFLREVSTLYNWTMIIWILWHSTSFLSLTIGLPQCSKY